MLRALPLATFAEASLGQMSAELNAQLLSLFFRRTSNPTEFSDVRKVAAELLSRLDPKAVVPLALDCICENAKVAVGGTRGGSSVLDCDDSAYTTAKLMVFSICSLLAHRQSAAAAVHSSAIATVLLQVLQIPCVLQHGQETSELRKLQHGSIDTLGILIGMCSLDKGKPCRSGNDGSGGGAVLSHPPTGTRAMLAQQQEAGAAPLVPLVSLSAGEPTSQRPSIIMLSDDDCGRANAMPTLSSGAARHDGGGSDGAQHSTATAAAGAVHVVLRGLAGQLQDCAASVSIPFRICMANALISSSQHAARRSADDCVRICSSVYSASVNSLLSCAGAATTPTPVRAAAVQVLFTLCFRLLSTEAFDSDMIDLADLCAVLLNSNATSTQTGEDSGASGGRGSADAAGDDAGMLRLAGLKLLMALLGRVEQQSSAALPGSTIARLSGLLRGVAHMDPSSETRNLAAQCLRQMQVDGF